MTSDKKHKRILDTLILPGESRNRKYRNENKFDATRPVVLFWLTIAYMSLAFCLIIGIPWPGLDPEPVAPEDLPVAITVAVFFYIFIVGGLFIRDKLKKR